MSLVKTSAPSCAWTSLAVNDDGEYTLAGCSTDLYISQDFGQIWTPLNTPSVSVSMDNSGQYMAFLDANNGVWYSEDFGMNWSKSSEMSSAVSYSVIAVSGSGSKVYVGTTNQNNLYVSNDHGASFTSNSNAPDYCIDMATSTTGQYLAIVSSDINYQGVQVSSNFGASFQKYLLSDSYDYFTSVTMSSSGKYIAAGSGGGDIYVSNNFGSTWTRRADYYSHGHLTNLRDISAGATGTDMVVVGDDTVQGYAVSTNHGQKWSSLKDQSYDLNLVTLTGNSKIAVFAEENGGIYISKTLFDKSEKKLSVGAIVGITVGVVGTALILAAIYYKKLFCFAPRNKSTPADPPTANKAEGSYEALIQNADDC